MNGFFSIRSLRMASRRKRDHVGLGERFLVLEGKAVVLVAILVVVRNLGRGFGTAPHPSITSSELLNTGTELETAKQTCEV